MSRRKRTGFTIIELIAALGLSGLVLGGAALLLDQLSDQAQRISATALATTRHGTSARTLHALLLDAQPGTDSTTSFVGDARSTAFSTRCQRATGWGEHCRATLSVDLRPDTSVLMAELSTGERLVLGQWPGAAALRYLKAAGDSAWSEQWTSRIRLPAALGVVTAADTIVLPIGGARE
jgi:hypothetical protein